MQLRASIVLLWVLCVRAPAFSLLGPFEEWQTPALGYNALNSDVGAPRLLHEEYRWNLPVITYGFDRGFMDYFGLPGVQAIEEAIDVLNNLPPASEMDLSRFPLDARRADYRAQEANLLDLKSTALALLVEQLGLAAPERWVWSLRGRSVSPSVGLTNYLVGQFNFDPETLEPRPYVNSNRYSYRVLEYDDPVLADAFEIDFVGAATTVAGAVANPWNISLSAGIFFTLLSRDDAGGLKYLLHPGNLNHEPLPEGVVATDGKALINEAVRPGRNKLRFEPVPPEWEQTPGWSYVVEFTDQYVDGFELKEQRVERTITKPDILFTAADLGKPGSVAPKRWEVTPPRFAGRAGMTAAGPGIMQPGVVITFGMLGFVNVNSSPGAMTEEEVSWQLPRWASFHASTNAPITFPIGLSGRRTAKLSVKVERTEEGEVWRLNVEGTPFIPYVLQRSTDLRIWEDVERMESATGLYSRVMEDGIHAFYRTIWRE